MQAHERSLDPHNSIKQAIGGAAFMLGMQYAPTGWFGGLLGLIVFPLMVTAIAKVVLQRTADTPGRLFQAKRFAGSMLVGVCVWLAVLSAHQTSHEECTHATRGRDAECVKWARVPGGDGEKALMFMVFGGFALWRTAVLKEPPPSELRAAH